MHLHLLGFCAPNLAFGVSLAHLLGLVVVAVAGTVRRTFALARTGPGAEVHAVARAVSFGHHPAAHSPSLLLAGCSNRRPIARTDPDRNHIHRTAGRIR